jgi:hypothetical protein
MKMRVGLFLALFGLGVVAGNVFGTAQVFGYNDPGDFNDAQVNERLTEAGRNCRNSPQSCPVGDEFIVENHDTTALGRFTWTGTGWRDVRGQTMPIPCGPLDCGNDDPIGHNQGS